jgi:membrane protease subunit (stomatin/prohibitin family)
MSPEMKDDLRYKKEKRQKDGNADRQKKEKRWKGSKWHREKETEKCGKHRANIMHGSVSGFILECKC